MNERVERYHNRLKHLKGWDWVFGVLHCSDYEIHEVFDKMEAEYDHKIAVLQQENIELYRQVRRLRAKLGDNR